MINVIIPIVENPKAYTEIITQLSLKRGLQIIVGITETLSKEVDFNFSNVVQTIYKDGSRKEEIINSSQKYLVEGELVIARRPFSLKEFNALFSSPASITFVKGKPTNKITTFFKNLCYSLVKLIFGVRLFEGDSSLIRFDEDLTLVLSQAENFSYSTRIDRWKGVAKQAIDVESLTSTKNEVNKKSSIMLLIYSLLSIATGAVVTTCVLLFARLSIIIGLLIVCLDVLCLMTAFFCLVSLAFNNKIGQKNFGFAIPVENEKLIIKNDENIDIELTEKEEDNKNTVLKNENNIETTEKSSGTKAVNKRKKSDNK